MNTISEKHLKSAKLKLHNLHKSLLVPTVYYRGYNPN